MASIQQQISSLLAAHKVVIFSKTTCPYCTAAKRAFAAIGVSPFVQELDQDASTMGAYQQALGAMTGATSVPRVFINGTFLGGGDDTVAAQRSGKLAELCRAAGAL